MILLAALAVLPKEALPLGTNREGGGGLADKSSMAKSRAFDPISKSYIAAVLSSELWRDDGGGGGEGDCERSSPAGELPGRGESRASSNGDEGASSVLMTCEHIQVGLVVGAAM